MTWSFSLHHSAAPHLYVQHQEGAAVIYFRQAWGVFVSAANKQMTVAMPGLWKKYGKTVSMPLK